MGVNLGLHETVGKKLEELLDTGKLSLSEFDEKILDELKLYPVDATLAGLEEFANCNLEYICNKSAYLCGIIRLHCRKAETDSQSIDIDGSEVETLKLKLNYTPPKCNAMEVDLKIKELQDFGLNESVVDKLGELLKKGELLESDLDDCTLEALKECPVGSALTALKEFQDCRCLRCLSNRSAYLCGIISMYNKKNEQCAQEIGSKISDGQTFKNMLDISSFYSNNKEVNYKFKIFENYELCDIPVAELRKLLASEQLSFSDIDEKSLEALKKCPVDRILAYLKKFRDKSYQYISDESVNLCNTLENVSLKNGEGYQDVKPKEFEEEKNKEILNTIPTTWNAADIDSNSKMLRDYDLSEIVVKKLDELFTARKLLFSDLDYRTLKALKECPVTSALAALEEFVSSELDHINNKSAYLCGIIKLHCQKTKMITQAGDYKTHYEDKNRSTSGRTSPAMHATHIDLKCKELEDYGLNDSVVNEIRELLMTAKLSVFDLDKWTVGRLKEISVRDAVTVLKEFKHSSLQRVFDKSAYLCGVMKANKRKREDEIQSVAKKRSAGNRTKTTFHSSSLKKKVIPPNSGVEIFVQKIPETIFEDELISVFEKCGRIWDLRLLMDHMTGLNRGYAFVKYFSSESAHAAVEQLNNYKIKRGYYLKVSISVLNLRIFIGNIPKSKSKQDIFEEFRKLTAGLTDVINYSFHGNRRNSGFCFLEYESYIAASAAKAKLKTGKLKMWGCNIIID